MILITALLKGFDWLVGETESGVSNGAQTIFLSLVMVCLRYGSDYFKLKNAGENPGWEHWQREFSHSGKASISRDQLQSYLETDPLLSGVNWHSPTEVVFLVRTTFFQKLRVTISSKEGIVGIKVKNTHFLHPGAVSALTLMGLLFRLEKHLSNH